MSYENVNELEDSTKLMADPAALRARFERDGALLLRGVLNADLVAWARGRFKDALSAEGQIDPAVEDPIWTGVKSDKWRVCDSLGMSVWPKIAADEKINALLRDVMEEDATWLPIVAHRSALPSGPLTEGQDIFVMRHQDGFYNEGMNFTQLWIPLMDIPRANGGLAVALGMHKQGYLHPSAEPFNIPQGKIPDAAWHTVDYRVGDVLIFNFLTPHLPLPNLTNQIRLSIDFRVTHRSAPQPVIGTVVNLQGTDVTIHTDEGKDVKVAVSDATFIRKMNPHPRILTKDLDQVAHIGARVLAMAGEDGKATVVRTNFY